MSQGTEQYLEQRQKLDRQVIERAMTDPDFRESLQGDPKATLEAEYGIRIPEQAEVKVLEEDANTHFFVLPPAPIMGELSEEELEAVAGGWYVNLLWSSLCFGSGDGGPDNADISVSAT